MKATIEDIYPLSPLQAGFLFHTLYEKRSDAYILQSVYEISEKVDVSLVKEAWNLLLPKYEVFRTGVQWEDLDEPLQYVLDTVELPWVEDDWRQYSYVDQKIKLEQYLEEDRKKGFDVSIPPLIRISMIRCDADRYFMLVTRHHIIVDGWCSPIIMGHFLENYAALKVGHVTNNKKPLPYREYINWLSRQDEQQAEHFWRTELEGFYEISRMCDKKDIDKEGSHSEYQIELPKNQLDLLKELAQSKQVTLNTVVQAAWSIVLSRYSQKEDVLFGITVSGRSIDLPGVEDMVGLFINTLPLRINVDEYLNISQFLKNIQAKTAELNRYAHTSLAKIQTWAKTSGEKGVFDHILIFENYSTKKLDQNNGSFLRLERIGGKEKTEYPLTIAVLPKSSGLEINFGYQENHFSLNQIKNIATHFEKSLCALSEFKNANIFDINLITSPPRKMSFVDFAFEESSSSRKEKMLGVN